MKKIHKHLFPPRTIFIITLCWAACITALMIIEPISVKTINYKLFDMFLKTTESQKVWDKIAIVDIDDQSLATIGQWPWPRYRMAQLTKMIIAGGARVIGFDILFSEPDRTSLIMVQQKMKTEMGLDIDLGNIPAEMLDHDHLFGDAIKEGPVILGFFWDYYRYNTLNPFSPLKALSVTQRDLTPGHPSVINFASPKGVVLPIPILAAAAKKLGFLNAMPDEDGILRRIPFFCEWQGKYYPSLSLAILQLMVGQKGVLLDMHNAGVDSLMIGNIRVPLDAKGRFQLKYRGKSRKFSYYSAGRILSGEMPGNFFKDKIVLVGTTAAGLKDLHTTPFDAQFPGIEAHATLLDNVHAKDFIYHPRWLSSLQLFLILLVWICSLFAFNRLSIVWSSLGFIGMACGSWALSLYLYRSESFLGSPLYVIMILMFNFFCMSISRFYAVDKEKRFLKTAFSKYVSKTIVEEIVRSPSNLAIEGEEKELSILFTDIRNFTSLSERLSPIQVSRLLQDFFTPMTHVITTNNGTLDKFIGDAMVAFWNAPLDVPNHKTLAVLSGTQMLSELGKINEIFKEKYQLELNIGIGLHAGRVRVGNMGTEELFDYTIIGDNVNLASRIEALTKYYGVRIILSEAMIPYCPSNFGIQELDVVTVRGKERSIKIYGLFTGYGVRNPEKHFSKYEEALALYKNRNFKDAQSLFADLRDEHKVRRLYHIYEERCRVYMDAPPDEKWDGVFRMPGRHLAQFRYLSQEIGG